MSVANGLLPAIVAKYRASRPGIEIMLREGVHGTVLEDIRSGTADLGITYVEDVCPISVGAHHREVWGECPGGPRSGMRWSIARTRRDPLRRPVLGKQCRTRASNHQLRD
jgi:DNA-binding transcriptional LysR family regulator